MASTRKEQWQYSRAALFPRSHPALNATPGTGLVHFTRTAAFTFTEHLLGVHQGLAHCAQNKESDE